MEKVVKKTPPYMSVAKLDQLFALLGTHSFSKLTMNDLKLRGFSEPDAFLAIQALKFLGMISDEGVPTERARVLSMKAEGKEQKLQEIVREAYKELFDTVPSAELLNRDNLHDELMAVYKISPRLANTAVPIFIWLCGKAGIKTSEEVKTRKTHVKSISSGTKNQEHGKIGQVGLYTHPPIGQPMIDLNISHTGIRLLIPKNEIIDDAVASGELTEVRQKIIEFAKKVGLIREDEINKIESKES